MNTAKSPLSGTHILVGRGREMTINMLIHPRSASATRKNNTGIGRRVGLLFYTEKSGQSLCKKPAGAALAPQARHTFGQGNSGYKGPGWELAWHI